MSRAITEIRLGHAANCSALGNVLNVLVWSQVAAAGVWAAAEAWQTRRRRPEPGGGETRLTQDPSALVRTGEAEGGPREAHLQITEACGLPCKSCYMETSAAGAHVPLEVVEERLRVLAREGVMRVALGGGEPLRHPDLASIAAAARSLGLAVGVTTSGVGTTTDLFGFDQVNVSLDGLGSTFTASRGYDGSAVALATIRRLALQRVRVGVNVVLEQDNFDEVEETVAAAVQAGARDVQLLRLKPVGKALAGYDTRRLTLPQRLAIWPLAQRLMARFPGVTVRLDCASVPFLAAHDVDIERLKAFGFRGCAGSVELVSMNTAGARHACSFVPGEANAAAWKRGVTEGPCADCAYQPICKGGCHAVAGAVTGERFAPDPECPRVIAAGASA